MIASTPPLASSYVLDNDTASISSSFKQLAVGADLYGRSFSQNLPPENTSGSSCFPHPPRDFNAYPLPVRPTTAPMGFAPHTWSLSSSVTGTVRSLLPTYKDASGNLYVMQPDGTMVALTPVSGYQGCMPESRASIISHLNAYGSEGPLPALPSVTRPLYAKRRSLVKRHSSYHHFRPLASRQTSQRKLRDSHAQLLDVLQFNGLVDHSACSRYGDLDTATLVLNSATSSARNSIRSSTRASTRSDYSPMGSVSFKDPAMLLLPP